MPAPLVGIDLTEPERLRRRLERSPGLAGKLFHPGELEYSNGQAAPEQHLAARFSAKEAVTKALGLHGLEPLDVEVIEGAERCALRLHGDAARRADQLDVLVTISLTHVAGMAAAVALALPSATREAAAPPSGDQARGSDHRSST